MSLTSVTKNVTRCKKIANETDFQADVKAGKLPQFSYYTPDMNHDGHDTSLTYAATFLKNWLATWVDGYPNTWKKVLLLITFDEDDNNTENNHIAAMFRGKGLRWARDAGTTTYTHYSITKFVERNFNLSNLGSNDVLANDFTALVTPLPST